ncbi:DB domain-containing protein [Aphelenchoides fujianensis]|nr:DB domain-containing protein [Aphelenchoides fujianensis]
MCQYETDQQKAKDLMIQMVNSKTATIGSVANALGLTDPALNVGSRCLRMCDPSGSSIGKITKDDVTCLFNWGVVNFCHQSGIREM